MSEKVTVSDLDLQIRVRSSKMSVSELTKITNLLVETLRGSGVLDLVEQNMIVNQNADRKLITITSNFQMAK